MYKVYKMYKIMYKMYCYHIHPFPHFLIPPTGASLLFLCLKYQFFGVVVLGFEQDGEGGRGGASVGVMQALCHRTASQSTKKPEFYTEGKAKPKSPEKTIQRKGWNTDMTTKSSKMKKTTKLKMEPLSQCQALPDRQIS